MTHRPQLFRLDASLAGDTSVSRAVADTFERTWLREHPDGTVLRRDLGAQPVPMIDMTAVGARFTPAADRTPEQREALELAETLTAELRLLGRVPLRRTALQLDQPGEPAGVGRPHLHRDAAARRRGRADRWPAGCRRPQSRRWLRSRHTARGLGPRRAVPAPDPDRRVEARRHDGHRRADAGRDCPRDGAPQGRRRGVPAGGPHRRRGPRPTGGRARQSATDADVDVTGLRTAV